jgi:hypothetical protein
MAGVGSVVHLAAAVPKTVTLGPTIVTTLGFVPYGTTLAADRWIRSDAGLINTRETSPAGAETPAVKGASLAVGTGPLTHVAQADGVLDNLTSITTRSLDSITDGATYKKVTGVDGSNKVSSTSIAAQAVTGPSVATNAIAAVHLAQGDSRVSVNKNPYFVQRLR